MTGIHRFAALSALAVTVLQIAPAHAQQENPDAGIPLYLSLDTPPAPVLSPEEALDAFATAPGFNIELVAAEPLVEDPVAITWDEDGRLYVAEMRGFMPDAFGTGQTAPVGMVVRLTDADEDGRLDRREVLLDALVLPRAIAVVNAGLLVGEPPDLWLCPTATGRSADIDCAARKRIGDYGDPASNSVEHDENGLLPGLDNWLYNAKSARRLRLLGGELEVEETLFRGQWGIAQDDDGRLYYNTNSNLPLRRLLSCRVRHPLGQHDRAGPRRARPRRRRDVQHPRQPRRQPRVSPGRAARGRAPAAADVRERHDRVPRLAVSGGASERRLRDRTGGECRCATPSRAEGYRDRLRARAVPGRGVGPAGVSRVDRRALSACRREGRPGRRAVRHRHVPRHHPGPRVHHGRAAGAGSGAWPRPAAGHGPDLARDARGGSPPRTPGRICRMPPPGSC